MSDPRRSEFGDFLRSRRQKLTPHAAGLPDGRRRRTPGLRREEVAELAGIGVDWYVRLEQGRAVSPSAATVEALARALRLGAAEHAHLRALARDGGRRAWSLETVPDPVRRLVESLPHPAYVTGRRWDVLAWNAAASDTFGDFGAFPEPERNILLFVLAMPEGRRLFGDAWEEEARRMVAQFRAVHDLWAADPAFRDLLARLRGADSSFSGPGFATWWDAHDVRTGSSGRKVLHHPERGVLRFEYSTFQCNDDSALRLAIYMPAS